MNDPTMDQIERGLREMTEPRSEHSDEPTELWKRALEISRAEERAGLVHPAADREGTPRGRRMLIALNAVGVAAMIVLAAGVWTIMRPAKPGNQSPNHNAASVGPDVSEYAERGMSLFADERDDTRLANDDAFDSKAFSFAEPGSEVAMGEIDLEKLSAFDRVDEPAQLADLGRAAEAEQDLRSEIVSKASPESLSAQTRSRRIDKESVEAPAELSRQIAAAPKDTGMEAGRPDPMAAVDDSHPGISQMMMGFEQGLALDGGDASVMTFDPYLLNARIVIEVDDVTAAFNAVSELPLADFEEYSTIDPPEPEEADADENEKLEARMPDSLVLNMSPARLNQALDEIRGLGQVVEERVELDSPSRRAEAAIDWALVNTSPNFKRLETVIQAQGLTEHERAHRNLPLNDAEQLEAVREAFGEVVRRLEDTRRSMNLSRISVTIRRAPESDTIKE